MAATTTTNTSSRPSGGPLVPFGRPMRDLFPFSAAYNPLNHGSYGAHPTAVRAAHLAVRAEAESAPDPFIVFNFAPRLVAQRQLAADLLRCALEELVFVPNATTGIDTVLKNIRWAAGDVIVCYDVVYGSVANGLSWVKEVHGGVDVHVLKVSWPIADDELVAQYVAAVRAINAQPGKRVRLAICDTIVSMPGMRIPFEKLVPALRAEGALVLLDGAHGIGHVEIDLSLVQPDFFVTNLHKWLFVPRGCAAFVVRKELQALIRTTLPTSHGFQPVKPLEEGKIREDAYADMFAFTGKNVASSEVNSSGVGTADSTNWLTVDAAVKFRNETCGGEAVIREYTSAIAQRAAVIVADMFGTEILDHPGSCMRKCNFANVRLPLDYAAFEIPDTVVYWIKKTAVEESGVYFQLVGFQGAFYWRISGMIYLEEDDYRKGAEVLQKLCARVEKGEHLKQASS
ncbi:putative aminotransferase family protein [Microdochium trichocladiopsis]|uniref:Aminotransferase family protein n=1 Tax=Microdochium trichocladiopsis TaxID=1682393 RepID=A0A9P8Y9T8_9PEZI|nr:putative aminotransferase family protein [Microdochium trichocladiopsis]KAH7031581.1 putative aminotransferase family protein [Microdochium trichocladiopsis]